MVQKMVRARASQHSLARSLLEVSSGVCVITELGEEAGVLYCVVYGTTGAQSNPDADARTRDTSLWAGGGGGGGGSPTSQTFQSWIKA